MIDFFSNLFETEGFSPRWGCGTWSREHGWVHIIADSSIFAAYFAIPVLLTYFILRRRDIPFPPVFWLFAAFILSCGIGHAIEASIFWHPWYRFSGLVKVITAIVSWATVLSLIPLVPKALALPGLATINNQLLTEIARREQAELEQKQLEDQVRQSQKLESLGILAGGIAHDFNNILTGVLGYIDLARMELPPGSPARGLMEEAMKNTHRAADLTKQMLAYSGKGRFVVQPLSLTQLVIDTTRLLEVSISKKSTMKFDLAPRIPACEADATQLGQVVMNLVINASEAMNDHPGLITISTGSIDCDRSYLKESYLDDTLPGGKYVFLEVTDTGCGMTEETRKKIFDPFFTTKFTGRGLGLAAVLGIVRGHRGAIKVTSEHGRGSTFRVLLPATTQIIESATTESPRVVDAHSQGTVLVVDDEEVVRDLASAMLQRMGLQVLLANDGHQGVEMFRANRDRIQLVLLDLLMPRLDGAEAYQELRKISPGVRVILTSGYDEKVATDRFAGSGMAGFIQKPYSFEQLSSVVRTALAPARPSD